MSTFEALRRYPCQELVELVTEYLEDTLSPFERASFEAHLAVCVGCRDHVDQMRRTIEVVGKLPVEPVAPEVRQNLLELFRGWKRGES